MIPATMNRFVTIYTNTMAVRMQAILFASASVVPAFSPSAKAHNRHMVMLPIQSTTALTASKTKRTATKTGLTDTKEHILYSGPCTIPVRSCG